MSAARRASPLVLVALLVAAMALGAALDRLWLVRRGMLVPGGLPAAQLSRPSDAQLAAMRARLKAELSITPEQSPRVDRIIDQQIAALERLQRDVRPRIDSIFEDTRLAMDSVLTAPQRARRDSLLRRLAPLIDSIGVRRPGR